VIETERLRLRDFREDERDRYADLMGDPQIGAWLAGALSREQSDAAFDRARAAIAARGYGYWAVERRSDGALIGQIGFNAVADDLPAAPALEMSWRLFPEVWGQGLASEGAAGALAWGLAHLPARLPIVAFTAATNRRSESVMRKIGLIRAAHLDFDHPRLAADHPLRPHIVYIAQRPS
jgi:RimJ/RimL family protein N-acetyltransferase